MKRLTLILMAAVMLLCTGCGSGSDPAVTEAPQVTPTAAPTATPSPVVLEVCVGSETYTLDPTYINDVEAPDYMGHLFEGLTKYVPVENPDGAAVVEMALTLGMAASYVISDDGLTYTFTLRDDAVWSDGVPVTAGDFVYAWRRLFTPAGEDEVKHSASAEQLFGVLKNATEVSRGQAAPEKLGVQAADDKTLVVTLEQECSHFLKLCASVCLLPLRQDLIEAYGGDWTVEENLVVNGAFTLTELIHDDHMTLTKNPLYYDAEAIGPDSIIWHFSDDPDQAADGADFTAGVSESLEGAAALPRAGTYYLYLNVNNIKNWKVRAAMTLALDRDAIAAAVGGGATAAVGMIPAGIADSSGGEYVPAEDAADLPLYAWLQAEYPDYDLNTYEGRSRLARVLFDEAVAAGSWYRSYKVYYRFNESTVNRLVAETCQANWKDVLGMTAEFALVEADSYAESLKNGSFHVAYLAWLPDYNDARSFLDIMRRGGDYNHSEWGDGAYTELVDAVLTEYDPDERDALLLAADGALFTEWRFAVCPVFFYGDTYTAAEGLTNVGHSGSGYFSFHYARLE